MALRIGILWAVAFAFTIPAMAEVKIKSLRLDKKRIVVEAIDETLSNGQSLEARNDFDETCTFKVTKVQGKFAAVDIGNCSFASDLKVGQSLSGGGGGSKSSGGSSSFSGMKHYFGPQIYYSMASDIDAATSTTSVVYKGAGALGVGGLYKLQFMENFGAMAGLAYEMPRSIPSRSVGSLTQTFTNQLVLSFLWFEANGYFSWGPFMGYVGFNYNSPSLANATNTTISGEMGIQMGAQYSITEMFAVDLGYRTINFAVTEGSTSYTYARLWGIMARGIVYF